MKMAGEELRIDLCSWDIKSLGGDIILAQRGVQVLFSCKTGFLLSSLYRQINSKAQVA